MNLFFDFIFLKNFDILAYRGFWKSDIFNSTVSV